MNRSAAQVSIWLVVLRLHHLAIAALFDRAHPAPPLVIGPRFYPSRSLATARMRHAAAPASLSCGRESIDQSLRLADRGHDRLRADPGEPGQRRRSLAGATFRDGQSTVEAPERFAGRRRAPRRPFVDRVPGGRAAAGLPPQPGRPMVDLLVPGMPEHFVARMRGLWLAYPDGSLITARPAHGRLLDSRGPAGVNRRWPASDGRADAACHPRDRRPDVGHAAACPQPPARYRHPANRRDDNHWCIAGQSHRLRLAGLSTGIIHP